MENLIGLQILWECSSCGTLQPTNTPATTSKLLKAGIREPTCSCGSKFFKIINFKQINYIQEKGDTQ